MINYFIFILMSLSASTGFAYDKDYYSLNPNALQEAVRACPSIKPKDATCEQVNEIATQMNDLAAELMTSPQAFGQKVLQLQQLIAKETYALKNAPKSSNLYAEVEKHKQSLHERLAVIKWLESPGNKS